MAILLLSFVFALVSTSRGLEEYASSGPLHNHFDLDLHPNLKKYFCSLLPTCVDGDWSSEQQCRQGECKFPSTLGNRDPSSGSEELKEVNMPYDIRIRSPFETIKHMLLLLLVKSLLFIFDLETEICICRLEGGTNTMMPTQKFNNGSSTHLCREVSTS